MKILYIPFTHEDAFFDLQLKAMKWREDYKIKDKELIIVYHGSDEIMKQETIQQALRAGECQIYILSHGINTPELIVSNQNKKDETYKEITIDEVAQHFQSDLVIPEFSDNNVVKLFFCDEYKQDNKSRKMAEQFRKQLARPLQKMEVKYYTDVSVGIPGANTEGLLSSKAALKSLRIANDLFYFNLTCLVGRAKSFRQGLNDVQSSTLLPRFFTSLPQKEIKYPEFSHPLIRQLAETLVKIIQSDKSFSKNQEHIIDELLLCLPRDIKDYLVNSLTITGKNIKFELQINKSLLERYSIKNETISTERSNNNQKASSSDSKKPAPSWIDEEDFLSVVNTPFS